MVRAGYKQTEVGEIPDGWQLVAYGDYLDIFAGLGFKKSEYSSHGLNLIRIDNVSYGCITWDSIEYLPKEYLKKYPKLILNEDDILLALNRPITNNQLKIARVKSWDLPAILYQRVGKIVFLGEGIDRQYAYHVLSKHIKNFVEQSAVGTDQPFISTTKLKKFKFPIAVRLDEQKAIAKALSDMDELIASLEKLIAKKRDIKTATMQQLLTGKKRLPGFGEGKGYKQTELGEIPEDWDVVELGGISIIEMGQSPSSANYNAKGLGLPLIQGNADIRDRKTIIRNHTTQVTKLAKTGDIILSVRAPVGEVATALFDCCIGRGVCAIRYKNDYLYHWLISFEPSWNKFSKGSTFDSISSEELKEIKLPLPVNEKEQLAIAMILSDLDNDIAGLNKKLNKTKAIKQGMMQELLTGRTRLVEPQQVAVEEKRMHGT